MAKEAALKALADAKIDYSAVQQAVCGYVYGMKKLRNFNSAIKKAHGTLNFKLLLVKATALLVREPCMKSE